MAELNLKHIVDKLNTEITGDTRKLVFWYDEKGEVQKYKGFQRLDSSKRLVF